MSSAFLLFLSSISSLFLWFSSFSFLPFFPSFFFYLSANFTCDKMPEVRRKRWWSYSRKIIYRTCLATISQTQVHFLFFYYSIFIRSNLLFIFLLLNLSFFFLIYHFGVSLDTFFVFLKYFFFSLISLQFILISFFFFPWIKFFRIFSLYDVYLITFTSIRVNY